MEEAKRKFIEAFVELAKNTDIIKDSEGVVLRSEVYENCSIVKFSFSMKIIDIIDKDETIKSCDWAELLKNAIREFKIESKDYGKRN